MGTLRRISCCVPVRIMRAVHSCKNPYTRKSCVRWLSDVIFVGPVVPLSEVSGAFLACAWRALLLPHYGRTFRSHEDGGFRVLRSCGDIESMCLDWFAHDGSRRCSLSNSAFLVIYEICGDMVAEKSPDWNSDVDDWTESEGLSSFEERGHNVESLAREVIGQNGSGEMFLSILRIGSLHRWH